MMRNHHQVCAFSVSILHIRYFSFCVDMMLFATNKAYTHDNRGCTFKRRRTHADTGSYNPLISNAADKRAKRMKILKQKRTPKTGII